MPVLRVTRGTRREAIAFEGQPTLIELLAAHGYAVARPCGGRGVCGKCAVTLAGAVSPANGAERRAGARLSCQAVLLGDCEAVLPDERPLEQIEGGSGETARAKSGAPLGAAVDVGTTTLALRLYDTQTAQLLATATAANPQTAIAADVMGRIGEALQGKAELLRQQVTQALSALLAQACAAAGCAPERVGERVIAGNTTMLYLLTRRDPEALSHAPFQADCLFGFKEQIDGHAAYLPPCMHAFVGADITCAALASGMCQKPETALLCDVGTNGEMALWKDGVLYVASTAAGPAFEGAGIVQGCGSVRGAIDRCWVEGGAVGVHTLGDAPAVGLCGSGLIDAVAAFLQLERIDETGTTDEERLPLTRDVALYPQDIRNVQLAKAAIAAGMETLMVEAGVQARDVGKLYIAGGFGNHLDLRSAAAIGLIPAALTGKAVFIGNGSLAGASELLLRPDSAREAERIASLARHVSLGGCPAFNQAYIEQMLFPE